MVAAQEPLGPYTRSGGDQRLRIVEELEARRERSRVRSVLGNAAISLRRRLSLVTRVVGRTGLWQRLASWWSRLRSWLRPGATSLRRAGVALPVWLATSGRAQQLAGGVAHVVGRGLREALFLSSDAVTWLAWRLGDTGQAVARWYGYLIERVILTAEQVASQVSGWLSWLHADRWHVALAHDIAGVLAGMRTMAGLLPAPIRVGIMLAAAVMLLARHQGPLSEAWVRLRINRFTVPVPAGASPVAIPLASRPRSARPQSRNRSGQRARRR